jgi:hypothetical protein
LYTTRDAIKALADVPADIDELKSSVDKLDSAYEEVSKF